MIYSIILVLLSSFSLSSYLEQESTPLQEIEPRVNVPEPYSRLRVDTCGEWTIEDESEHGGIMVGRERRRVRRIEIRSRRSQSSNPSSQRRNAKQLVLPENISKIETLIEEETVSVA